MGQEVLAFYTQDMNYASAFMDYCTSVEQGRIQVKAFTNEESLQYYISTNRVDLIVVEQLLYNKELFGEVSNVIVLSEDKRVKDIGCPVIFQYQRVDRLFQQIYEVLAQQEEVVDTYRLVKGCIPKVIGVFSPCYNNEREQLSREIASYLGCQNHVLYINLSMFSAYDLGEQEGISELLYFLQDESRSIRYKLPTVIRQEDNYKRVAGVRHYKDLLEIEIEEWRRLFKQLRLLEEYNYIVIDMSFLGDSSLSVLEQCDIIYSPLVEEGENRDRVEHFNHDMQLEEKDALLKNIIYISINREWNEKETGRRKVVKSYLERLDG